MRSDLSLMTPTTESRRERLGRFPDKSAPRPFDRIVEVLRVWHDRRRTEEAWLRGHLALHQRRHPRQRSAGEAGHVPMLPRGGPSFLAGVSAARRGDTPAGLGQWLWSRRATASFGPEVSAPPSPVAPAVRVPAGTSLAERDNRGGSGVRSPPTPCPDGKGNQRNRRGDRSACPRGDQRQAVRRGGQSPISRGLGGNRPIVRAWAATEERSQA